ncbi:MAG TPA: hypothetical protein VMW65_12365 [Chloroflexota bacterium]|nr:hypothetical protein [Chloroflexota bacterium]
MQQSGHSSSLVTLIILLGIIAWLVYRRTRPQPVRLTRTIIYTALIVVVSLAGLAANLAVLGNPVFLAIAPLALLVGLALGWLMMRTIRFWRDRSTGQVWMSGGIAYVAIWLATLALRLGVEYAATGNFSMSELSRPTGAPTLLAIIASDLLFLSVGLWLARGYALARRYRELSAASAP